MEKTIYELYEKFIRSQKARQELNPKPRRLGNDYAAKILTEANRPLPIPTILRIFFRRFPNLKRACVIPDNYRQSLRKLQEMQPYLCFQ